MYNDSADLRGKARHVPKHFMGLVRTYGLAENDEEYMCTLSV